MDKVKIGLLGVGHLGKIHLKCLKNTEFELVGIYDPDPAVQAYVKKEHQIPVFKSAEKLIAAVDAVDIVSTTITHYDLAIYAINNGKHAFIEKPVASSLGKAKQILAATAKNGVKVQVGHVERYNPAIVSLKDRNVSPKFIEGHRLTTFNTRGNDVSVILDLMIHDLDLILELVKSEIVDVQANGVCVVNDTPDICNARITFQNGCVANLTGSRISVKQMRKLRIFQENEYISLDFLKKESQIIKLRSAEKEETIEGMTIDTNNGKKIITIENPAIVENNAIEDELKDFYNSIKYDSEVSVPVEAGVKALELAYLIAGKIQ
ncbi:MAG: Gfo/Idh/MocA family oxidoreductase [Saprospiraceae bacterium]|nr:Gfo/Idh/MocA family oxidoreductase [Saprospiraceae bacterium]